MYKYQKSVYQVYTKFHHNYPAETEDFDYTKNQKMFKDDFKN